MPITFALLAHSGAQPIGPISGAGLTDLFKSLTGWLADWVELVAAILIAFAVIEATYSALRLFTRGHASSEAKESLRLRLGRWLAVALEFELAADILRTAIAPTWNEIGLLAAVAGIRTALNFFLEKEIQRAAQHATSATATGSVGSPATSALAPRQRADHLLDHLRAARPSGAPVESEPQAQ